MDYIVRAIRDEFVEIRSPYFVDEMGDLERDENRQSLRCTYGGHDDLFVAMGQVYFSCHILEIRGNQPLIGEQRKSRMSADFVDPVWKPGYQVTDTEGTPGVSLRESLLEAVEELEY